MAYGDAYLEYRRIYSDISGHQAIAAADTTTTLVTNRDSTNDTIFIQKIRAYVLTSAAQTASFQDSGVPKIIARIASSPVVDSPYEWDFGPRGIPLAAGKNFVLSLSAAGLALNVEWDGYSKRTVVASA